MTRDDTTPGPITTPGVGAPITTVDELDALPVGSVVRDGLGGIFERKATTLRWPGEGEPPLGWYRTGSALPEPTDGTRPAATVQAPATLLHRPDVPPVPVDDDTVESAAHYELVAYADDVAEGIDGEVPDDYERRYCAEDGDDWPCSTVRAADRVWQAAATLAHDALQEHADECEAQGIPAARVSAIRHSALVARAALAAAREPAGSLRDRVLALTDSPIHLDDTTDGCVPVRLLRTEVAAREPVTQDDREALAAADALEAAVHLVDDVEAAQTLARLADQWRAQAGTARSSAPTVTAEQVREAAVRLCDMWAWSWESDVGVPTPEAEAEWTVRDVLAALGIGVQPRPPRSRHDASEPCTPPPTEEPTMPTCTFCGQARDDLSIGSDGETFACDDCRSEADR